MLALTPVPHLRNTIEPAMVGKQWRFEAELAGN
jgi:hypothetical protein